MLIVYKKAFEGPKGFTKRDALSCILNVLEHVQVLQVVHLLGKLLQVRAPGFWCSVSIP